MNTIATMSITLAVGLALPASALAQTTRGGGPPRTPFTGREVELPPYTGPTDIPGVIAALNDHPTVDTTEDSKSWRILFDAYLALGTPPHAVDDQHNLRSIHPDMSGWADFSGWAESHPDMARAIRECRDKTVVGLPYGIEEVPRQYRDAGIYVEIGAGGSLRDNRFPYLKAVDTIAAFATAEIYRLMEAGDMHGGLELAMAEIFVLRQFCDREFLAEKWHHVLLLADAVANLRDLFYAYRDKISGDQYFELAWYEIPYIRPDRSRLLMPEADKMVSQALIHEVFDDSNGMPDEQKFVRSFAGIQSKDKPLTRFGAARRWAMISRVHSSLDASRQRLSLVYDDWWRRWRVQEYDAILDIPTQFERTNAVRYAAVIYSMQDIQLLFQIRNRLIAEVNGAAVAAGICAYEREFKTYPNQSTKYLQFVRRRSDTDPYHPGYDRFGFRYLDEREAIDTPEGRLWLEPGQCLLYSLGQDLDEARPVEHTDDGFQGDIVLWPPLKAYGREHGYERPRS